MVKVIIVGGGRVGVRLIELLKKRWNYHITIIDDNRETLQLIEKKFEDINIVRGDATNKTVLERAGIAEADIIVAATSIDEVNLLIGITAQNYNLEKIIARTENPSHIKMFKKIGLNEVVSPELTTCRDIQQLIINPKIIKINTGGKEDYELMILSVKSNKVIGKEIGEISPSNNFIITMCYKNDEPVIAQNNIVLEKDDRVVVLARTKSAKKIKKYFTKSNRLLG